MKIILCMIVLIICSGLLGAIIHEEILLKDIKQTGECKSSCLTLKGHFNFKVK